MHQLSLTRIPSKYFKKMNATSLRTEIWTTLYKHHPKISLMLLLLTKKIGAPILRKDLSEDDWFVVLSLAKHMPDICLQFTNYGEGFMYCEHFSFRVDNSYIVQIDGIQYSVKCEDSPEKILKETFPTIDIIIVAELKVIRKYIRRAFQLNMESMFLVAYTASICFLCIQ